MKIRSLRPFWLLLFSLLLAAPALSGAANDAGRDRPGDFVINRPANLYQRPSVDSPIVRRLNPRTVVRVVEVTDQWYKIRSASGKEGGYIRRSYADPFEGRAGGRDGGGGSGERLRFRAGTFRLTSPVVVHAEPEISSRKVATLRAGAQVRVVDKQGVWYQIESEGGNRPPGWIPTTAAKRVEDGGAPAGDSSRYNPERRRPSRDDRGDNEVEARPSSRDVDDEEPAPSRRRGSSEDDWGRF